MLVLVAELARRLDLLTARAGGGCGCALETSSHTRTDTVTYSATKPGTGGLRLRGQETMPCIARVRAVCQLNTWPCRWAEGNTARLWQAMTMTTRRTLLLPFSQREHMITKHQYTRYQYCWCSREVEPRVLCRATCALLPRVLCSAHCASLCCFSASSQCCCSARTHRAGQAGRDALSLL